MAHGDGARISDVAVTVGAAQCSGEKRDEATASSERSVRRRLSEESDNEDSETNLQPGLEQEMLDTVGVACVLFDTDVPLMQRVQLLSGTPLARKVALEWQPTSIVGVGAEWFLETPRLQHMTTDCFLQLAPVFVNAVENLQAKVQLPILKQSLVLYASLAASRGGEQESSDWVDRLMSAALSARLGIPNKLASETMFAPETEVPSQVASAVWKATATYMAFVKPVLPQWFETWKKTRTSKADAMKQKRESKAQSEESAAAAAEKPWEATAKPEEATAKPQPANNGDDVRSITHDIIELWD